MPYLKGKVCLVTGASRGIGRGIALQLIVNGATCYITGRNLEKLNLVKEEAKNREACGKCIPVKCDHSDDDQVEELFNLIAKENDGRLDLLVNNAYSAINWMIDHASKTFWDQPIDGWDAINKVGLRNNYLCSVYAARLMVKRRKGLIVNISSVGAVVYFQTPAYGIGKLAQDRMAKDCGMDLEKYNVAFVSVWPGPVRTETVVESMEGFSYGSKSVQWLFDHGETTEFTGKCIASLLSDPDIMKRSGKVLLASDIAVEYNIKDIDGSTPLSMRSVRAMMVGFIGVGLAPYFPDFLKIPAWLFMALATTTKTIQPKQESKYA